MNEERSANHKKIPHVYWLGGGSGAGKSTIARGLAARYGLRLYSTDERMADHGRRSTKEACPLAHEFSSMTMDERWVNRSPEIMLETFHWFRGECFEFIVEDLLRLPSDPFVIVEGFRLLPSLVKPLLAMPSQAVWLLPTPDFRRAAFESRGSLWQIAKKTTDPERALSNLLIRDRMFTERLYEETKSLELRAIEIDTNMTEETLAEQVRKIFGL